jgi:opacity protein-like surface antigen
MKPILALLLLHCLLAIPSFSQSNEKYEPGWYLTTTGDTVHGLIYFNWAKNNVRQPPRFKSTGQKGTPIVLDAETVREIHTASGQEILSFPLPLNDGNTAVRFITKVASGPIDLFETRNLEENGPLRIYFIRKNGEISFVNHNSFPAFVRQHFSDCPMIQEKIKTYNPNYKSLVQLLKDGGSCSPSQNELVELKPEKDKSTWLGAEAGYAFGQFKFPDYYQRFSGKEISNLLIGGKIERKINQMSAGLGLNYDYSRGTLGQILSFDPSGQIVPLDVTISMKRIQAVPYARYWIGSGRFHVIPEAGLNLNVQFDSYFRDPATIFTNIVGDRFKSKYYINRLSIGVRVGMSLSYAINENMYIQPSYRYSANETEYDLRPNGFQPTSDIYEIKHQFTVAVIYKLPNKKD